MSDEESRILNFLCHSGLDPESHLSSFLCRPPLLSSPKASTCFRTSLALLTRCTLTKNQILRFRIKTFRNKTRGNTSRGKECGMTKNSKYEILRYSLRSFLKNDPYPVTLSVFCALFSLACITPSGSRFLFLYQGAL